MGEDMLTFKKFLLETQYSDKNYGLDNDSKGKLHELLVGKYLVDPYAKKGSSGLPQRPALPEGTKKKHKLSYTPEQLHDQISSKLKPEQYDYHDNVAKFAAHKIREGLKEHGHFKGNHGISKVHWTSNPSDIETLSGISDKANNADVVLRKKTKKNAHSPKLVIQGTDDSLIGVSLKVHSEKKPSGLANLGHGKLDELLHTDTLHIHNKAIEKSHDLAHSNGINTRDLKSLDKAHEVIKKNPSIAKQTQNFGNDAATKVAGIYRKKLQSMNSYHLTNMLRNLANVKETKSMPVYRSATYGTTNLTHEFVDPHKQAESIFEKHREHLHVASDSKGAMITFKGNKNTKTNKPITVATLNISRSGSTGFRQLRGILNGFNAGAKI